MKSFEVQGEGRLGQVKIRGDLDIATVPQAKSHVTELLEQGARDVVLDLTEIGHVDTTGLGFLVWVRKRVAETQGRLLLVGQNAHFRKLLEITGLHTLFTLCDDVTTARSQLS